MKGRPAPARLAKIAPLLVAAALASPSASFAKPRDDRATYIVVLENWVSHPGRVARAQAERRDATLKFIYRHALRGYAAVMTAGQAAGLSDNERVAYVERDGVVRISTTQTNSPWGLDRIDQRSRPLSGTFTYANTGRGVTAYILDSGIRKSHVEFGGRAIDGRDTIDGSLPAGDCAGHGTHVAGTVGGSTYGVAKQVTLVAVRVVNCSGSASTSNVIAGIDWVTADHKTGQPAVANMSLGGDPSPARDHALRKAIADGVSFVVAAGSGGIPGRGRNACNTSPARVREAMTISATDKTDRKPAWANYGNCVDWFAPGVSIKSAWASSDIATKKLSGTSMAAPHTTGVAALFLQSNPSASPAAVHKTLYDLTTKDIVTSSRTENNHLLYTTF